MDGNLRVILSTTLAIVAQTWLPMFYHYNTHITVIGLVAMLLQMAFDCSLSVQNSLCEQTLMLLRRRISYWQAYGSLSFAGTTPPPCSPVKSRVDRCSSGRCVTDQWCQGNALIMSSRRIIIGSRSGPTVIRPATYIQYPTVSRSLAPALQLGRDQLSCRRSSRVDPRCC